MLIDRSADLTPPPNKGHGQRTGQSAAVPQDASSRVSVIRWSTGLLEQLVAVGDAATMLAVAVGVVLAFPATRLLATDFHQGAVTVLMTVMACFALRRIHAYTLQRLRRVARPLLDVGASIGFASLLMEAVLLLTPWTTAADQAFVAAWAGLAFWVIALLRQAERLIVGRGLRNGVLRRKVAFVGATPQAEHLLRQLRLQDEREPSTLVGVFDDRLDTQRQRVVAGVPVTGDVDALYSYARHEPVDLIVIALPWQEAMDVFRQRVQWIPADVVITTDEGVFNARTASVATVAGEPVIQVARQPLRGGRGLVKLLEDYLVATVALLLVSPLMALVAVAIRLDSPGPAFFRQTRIGFNNTPFRIFKFRTMLVDENDCGTVGTGRHNPRITRVGAILRRLSIDEIPQLLNVLCGDMSVVGPRPHVPGMLVGDEEYAHAVWEYAARHRIKPGITGLAQVNGMRGGIHSIAKARRGVELDMTYVEKWSLGLDIRIMARTLLVGMFGSKVF